MKWLNICCVATILGVTTLVIRSPGFCQWQQVGLDGCAVWDLAFRASDSDTVYAAVRLSTTGIYMSIDGGQTWNAAGVVDPGGRALAVDPINKQYVYLACDGAIYRSGNAGSTWVRKDAGFNFNSDYAPMDIAVNPCHPESLYVTTGDFVGGGGLYCSANRGNAWSDVATPWNSRKGAIAIDPGDCGRMYLAVRSAGPFARSLNSGGSWQSILSVVVEDIAINPQNPSILYATAGGKVYRSADAGDTWTAFGPEVGLTGAVTRVAVNPIYPTAVYAGGVGGMFRSLDGGSTWADFSGGLPSGAEVYSIAIDPEHGEVVLAGTGSNGIYREEVTAGVSSRPDDVKASGLFLMANPNPFTMQMAISWSLPSSSHATVEAYDVAGRRVKTLIDGAMPAGAHSATWNGLDETGRPVSPGVYFIRLQLQDQQVLRKVTLLR